MQALDYIGDWSGNDWNGEPDASGEAQYVHGCGMQMYVTPDGTIYQGSTSGGDHGPACLYDTDASYVRDLVSGNDNGDTYKSYLQGIAANSSYHYVAVRIRHKTFVANQGSNSNGLPRVPADSTRQWYGVARYNRSDLSPAPFPGGRGSLANFSVIIDLPSSEYDRLPYLTGLAADDNYLYVADSLNGKVIRMDANNPDPAAATTLSWDFQNGSDLAIGTTGNLYVLDEGPGGLLQKFSPSGQLLNTRTFTPVEEPMAIAVDKTQSPYRVLIAMDHPAARQIWSYSSTLSKQSWTLGTAGGAAPGVFPEKNKFSYLKGVGVDSSGQIYVLEYGPDDLGSPDNMRNITRLQKFTAAGESLWTREAHGWIDSPGFSGLDDGVMYSTTGKYRLDYSKMDGSGRAWIWEGHTFDPDSYPDDPRVHNSMFGADVVNLGGVEFLTTFSGPQRGLAVYRFQNGVAVPAAIICPNSGGFGYAPSKPSKGWIWSDLDGAGDIDSSSEYTSATWKESNMNKSYIDANGDFWGFSDSSTAKPMVYHIPFTGLTSNGIPTWDIASSGPVDVSLIPGLPSPIQRLGVGVYDPQTDRMYLGVFTDRSPINVNQGEVAFQEIWCLGNWSTSPVFLWDVILSNPWTTGGGPHDLEFAGDYLFVGDSASADSGATTADDFQVRMFKKSDGGYVETLLPPANDKHLDFDRTRAIRPHLRPDGSYIVATEAFRTQKTQLFHIPAAAPDGEVPGTPQNVTATAISESQISLTWDESTDNIGVSGYRIYRSQALVAEVAGTPYIATALGALTEYSFNVTALDAAGNESAASAAAVATTFAAPDINSSLLAHWQFNDAEGMIAADAVGSSDGTLAGNPVWEPAAGKFAGSLKFDGDDLVAVDPLDISGSAMSIALWVKPTGFAGSAGEARFVSKASGTSLNDHHWMLGNCLDGTAIRFLLKTSAGNTVELVSAEGLLELNRWQHVGASYDGVKMRIFIDGMEVGGMARSGSIAAGASVGLGLGNQPAGAGSKGLVGLLDDVRIYSRALPEAEFATLASLSAYDVWSFAEIADPTRRQRLDDANSNGFPNLLEHAFGLDPDEPNPTGYPEAGLDGGFNIVFQRDIAAVNLTLVPQVTEDFDGDWGSGPGSVVEEMLSTSGTIQTIKATSLINPATSDQQFMRLIVIESP